MIVSKIETEAKHSGKGGGGKGREREEGKTVLFLLSRY